MRTFIIRDNESQTTTKTIIEAVLRNSPVKPITLDNMRLRGKITDKLVEATDSLSLTEDEWKVLDESVKTFPWAVFSKELLEILEDITGAVESNGKT